MSTANLSKKKFFTTGQIAKICGVSIATVQKWIDAGEIESYRLPLTASERRVPRQSLLTFMRKYELPTDELEGKESYRVLIAGLETQIRNQIDKIWAGLNQSAEVKVARDGIDFLVLIGSVKPHLIVMDLHLDGFEGTKVIEYLHKEEETKNIKIIVVSDLTDEERSLLGKLHVDAIVSRPFKPDKLKKIIIKAAEVA